MARSKEFFQPKENKNYWPWVGYGLIAIVVLGVAAVSFNELRDFITPKLPTVVGG